jgi:hypothetical protein
MVELQKESASGRTDESSVWAVQHCDAEQSREVDLFDLYVKNGCFIAGVVLRVP